MIISPQPGPQTKFLSNSSDILIYGGAAGGGKSFALLLDPLRYIHIPSFNAIIFRRTTPQIRQAGGIWDESQDLYRSLSAVPNYTDLRWTFPSGATIKFGQLEHEGTVHEYQGAQIAYIGFDELTHFTEYQFIYMLSRNRTKCGISPCIRATTNPKADSWVKGLIEWWLDDRNEYPDPSKSSVIRYCINLSGELIWANTRDDIIALGKKHVKHASVEDMVASISFVPANLYDNKILMDSNPKYLGKLMMQRPVERERLLNGNWRIKNEAGTFFKREWFDFVSMDDLPKGSYVRFWDLAATEVSNKNKDPDYTVGLLLLRGSDNIMYVVDVKRIRKSPGYVQSFVLGCAESDGRYTRIAIEQEPGSSGKAIIASFKKILSGYAMSGIPAKIDKGSRAFPSSGAASRGEIKLVRASWNDEFLNELESFDPDSKTDDHDDQVDAFSGAYEFLSRKKTNTKVMDDV